MDDFTDPFADPYERMPFGDAERFELLQLQADRDAERLDEEDEGEDAAVEAIAEVLRQSDIVWPCYGSQTVEELARAILGVDALGQS